VFVVLLQVSDQLPDEVGLGGQLLVGGAEHPVHVTPDEGAARVADGHPVRVDHGDNLEDYSLAESDRYFIFAQQEPDEAVDHP